MAGVRPNHRKAIEATQSSVKPHPSSDADWYGRLNRRASRSAGSPDQVTRGRPMSENAQRPIVRHKM